MRKYTELEELMCLGCRTKVHISTERKEESISAFAMKMWNASNVEELSKGSRKYDNCGFKITPSLVNVTNASRHFIIPSETFTGFLDMVNSIQIPFYEDYQVELVDEQQENSTTCFNDCNLIIVSFMFYIYILLLF